MTGTLQKVLGRLTLFNPQLLEVDVFIILFHPERERDRGRLRIVPKKTWLIRNWTGEGKQQI